MQTYSLSSLSEQQVDALCRRQAIDYTEVAKAVDDIQHRVLAEGDTALIDFARKFDGVELEGLSVKTEDFLNAETVVAESLKAAIRVAAANITRFHEQQKCSITPVETAPGVTCWQEFRPIRRVGLYVPGGSAPLFSTLLMLAIPARIAGCAEIIVCSPPGRDGKIHPAILWTARLLGIDTVFKVGGAQAVFALSHGTETIPKVDKIFGPGNRFVTAAKMAVSQRTAIDMPAGPSEVLVIADESANPAFVASDLLSQAEHGPDSQAVLLCLSDRFAGEVQSEIDRQLETLPRQSIARQSLARSFVLVCDSLVPAIGFSNRYAPEHLILQVEDWESLLPAIDSAGSVFCGPFSPEAAGDYASGTNHTLPTAGFARSYSGVSLQSFGKMISFQRLSRSGLVEIGPAVMAMAEAEGLKGHAAAVDIRLASSVSATNGE